MSGGDPPTDACEIFNIFEDWGDFYFQAMEWMKEDHKK
jgi:hypothetical protein